MGVKLRIGTRIARVPIFFFCFVWYNRIGDKMNILITGASSGIGYEMAEKFLQRGDYVIAVARREDKLNKLREISDKCKIITLDLSKKENCYKLHEICSEYKIDILVNNAGFGIVGEFTKTELQREIEMIEVNVQAVHILTKLFLCDMERENRGYILNVASIGGLMPGGPLFATYYATKAYVCSFTRGVMEELRQKKSNVKISLLCPGPVKTEFNKIANVRASSKEDTAEFIVNYAIKNINKNKSMTIIPNFKIKLLSVFSRILPSRIILKLTYKMQYKKME